MRRYLYAFLAFIIALAGGVFYATKAESLPPVTKTVERLVPTVPVTFAASVKINVGGGHGSGVSIGEGYIVTAAHVVGDAKVVSIKSTENKISSADVLWANHQYDVALLRTTARIPAALLSCANVKAGDDIESIGNPLGVEFVSSYGKVAGGIRSTPRVKSVFVTNSATVMGQSGGAIFHDGKIVGITSMVMVAPLKSGNSFVPSLVGFGFAVPSSIVCELMGRAV